MRWPTRLLMFGGALATASLTGCADDATVECLSNGVGEVCARADGAITFSASGLEPGSDIALDNEMVGPITLTADADGSFATDQAAGDVGVLSLIVGTEFVFDVTATDSQGEPLAGQITIASG